MRVKMILPALIEATGPGWRPIKYSLFPPLGLATLAGHLDPDDEVVLQDEHVEALDLSDQPDLVVIQVYITSARRSYEIADLYRRRGVYMAMGGLHVTSLPEEAARHADSIFLGPGEDIWPEFLADFLADFRAGRPRSRYESAVRTLVGIPPVRRAGPLIQGHGRPYRRSRAPAPGPHRQCRPRAPNPDRRPPRQCGEPARQRRRQPGRDARNNAPTNRAVGTPRRPADGLVSRLEAGASPMRPIDLDLVEVVKDVVAEARLRDPEAEIVVAARQAVLMRGDPERLHQVVTNLVDNALRYNPDGEPIRITVAHTEVAATIVIEDRGPGIPVEELHQVFERFHRANTDRAASTGGSGLGLAIAKWIVDQHCGTITAANANPTGCRITVQLPVAWIEYENSSH